MRKRPYFILVISVITILILGLTISCTPEPSEPSTPSTPSTPSVPSTPSTPTKTVTLKASFHAPPTAPAVVHFKDAFADIETMTEGRVKVDVYDSQTLVTMPETLDALNRGIADLSSVPLPPQRLDIPWWGVEMLPGALKDAKGEYDAAMGGMADMYQEALYSVGLKIKVPFLFCPGLTYFMTKEKRVSVPADLKGLKIAVGDAPSANVVNILGGTAVVLGFPETYEALLRGMVDGALGNCASLSQYKQQEPCDYLLIQPFGGPYASGLISEAALGKLSSGDQAILISLMKQYGLLETIQYGIGEQRMIDTLLKPELKEIVYPTPEQSQLWQEAVAPVIDEWLAKAGPDGQKALDIMRQYNP
jgi:TRAP-type C4-dicarboxylate transport system substrate-binding protein